MRGEDAEVVAIGGVPLSTAEDVLNYMQAMRNGTKASVSLHHITLSPEKEIDDIQSHQMVRETLKSLGAEDHAWVLWHHEKIRYAKGGGAPHFHLVVGHVGPDGKALDDGNSFRKLEAVARSLEVDWGHEVTPSRRAIRVARDLVEDRPDVAAAIVRAQGQELPKSAMTSNSRAATLRQGVDLPKVRAEIAAAWKNDGPEGVRKAGYEILPGKKPGVWIVVQNGVELGALDRLVRVKRAAIREAIEAESAQIAKFECSEKPVEHQIEGALDAGTHQIGLETPEAKPSASSMLERSENLNNSPELRKARDAVKQAEERRRRTYYGTLKSERAARMTMRDSAPRGFWAWLTGRTRKWRRTQAAAIAELDRIAKLRDVRRLELQRAKAELLQVKANVGYGGLDSERSELEGSHKLFPKQQIPNRNAKKNLVPSALVTSLRP
ncbi:relaxase/mobilization nuclease domain-containing protein [Roseibium sp.]